MTSRPFLEMTDTELRAEFEHWDREVREATHWGASLAQAAKWREACKRLLIERGEQKLKWLTYRRHSDNSVTAAPERAHDE